MVKKLQKRFITLAVLSVSFVFVAIIGILLGSNYYNVVNTSNNTIESLYEYYSQTGFESMVRDFPEGDFVHQPKTDEELAPLESRGPEGIAGARYFIVVLKDGEVDSVNIDHIFAIDESIAATLGQQVVNEDSGSYDNYRYIVFEDGDTKVVIFLDIYLEMQTFRDFVSNSVMLGLIGLVLFTFVSWSLSKIAIKPVAQSILKQKQFITDASHELKTPLTVISANNEMIEMDYGENSWSKAINKQIAKLTELTNSLVKLSRLDEEIENVKMEYFSLDQLLDEVIDEYQDLALVQNKTLKFVNTPVQYKGDRALIKQLLTIGLDNAFKYTEDEGEIEVSLSKSRKNQIIIKNSVRQIEIGEYPELFDRFSRLDKSRNSAIGGYGIGLAIAKSIVAKHRGKIKAYSRDGHSFVLKIEL